MNRVSTKKVRKTPSTSERKRKRNLKKRGKTTTVLLWIAKTRSTFFFNNQPTESTNIFTQNAVWNALETFSSTPDCESQKILKNNEESGVAYVRKVKRRSQSYPPVKERKNDYPKFQYRQACVNQTQTPSACYRCGKLHWAKDRPYRTKNVITAINSDIRAHSVETEK